MTALDYDPSRVEVRLRHAAEGAPGRRVLVDKEDLLALLSAPATIELPDLDELCGNPANNISPKATPPIHGDTTRPRVNRTPGPLQPPPGRGRGHVVLAATNVDAARLARAAWDSDVARVAGHGRWDELEPSPQWEVVLAARRAIDALLAEGDSR